MSINSPLGRRNLAQGQQPQQKVLTVQDESYSEPDFVPRNPYAQGAVPTNLQASMPVNPGLHPSLQQPPSELNGIQDMRRAAVAASKRVDESTRERIEYLAGIGRKTVDVNLDDSVFTLRTLKGKEMKLAMKAVTKFAETSPDYIYGLRDQILSRAIYQIDGMSLDLVLGDSTPEVVTSYLIDEMGDIPLGHLYSEFLKLHAEQREKYSVKSSGDLKEVADEVKKS